MSFTCDEYIKQEDIDETYKTMVKKAALKRKEFEKRNQSVKKGGPAKKNVVEAPKEIVQPTIEKIELINTNTQGKVEEITEAQIELFEKKLDAY